MTDPKPKPLSIADLRAAPYNPRRISPEALAGLKTSIVNFGDLSGITHNRATGNLVCGHQRLDSLKALHGAKIRIEGEPPVIVCPDGARFPIRVVDWDLATEKAANVAANSPLIAGEFDGAALESLLAETKAWDAGLFEDLRMDKLMAALNGLDPEGEATTTGEGDAPRASLSDRFGIPPFSVFDARQGYWQDRKRAWLALGIQSELGRGGGAWVESPNTGSPLNRKNEYGKTGGANATPGGSMMPAADYGKSKGRGDGKGRAVKGGI